MRVDALDRVIRNARDVMDSSRGQIFEIREHVRLDYDSLQTELAQVMEETNVLSEQLLQKERHYLDSRIQLTEVSRDFRRFTEEDVRKAYEFAYQQLNELTTLKEKDRHLASRRNDLERRLQHTDRQLEKAEHLASQLSVVLEYLSGDLSEATQVIESAKNRQLFGLRVILAQEEERKRIAREIHDGPAQSLAHHVVKAEIAERLLVRQQYDAVRVELHDLKAQMREGIDEMRKMIFHLRPMALDDLGLIPALRKLIQNYEEREKIHVELEVKGREQRLPSGMEAALYRLVQEALSNVAKHAHASYVKLEVQYTSDQITVCVADNGVGFDQDQIQDKISKGSHYGLVGMRERIELLEGQMQIESDPDNGTRITMIVPMEPELKEE